MPRKEFLDLIEEVKKTGQGVKLTKRDFIWIFDNYEKRSSGNIWRINEYLKNNKMVTVPNYQNGWFDEFITLKEQDKAKIKNISTENSSSEDRFDPINRLSLLEAASKSPVSVKRDDNLEKAYYLMWENGYSQLPIMNGHREIFGIISWKSIAKGLIAKKESNCVKDFMTNDFTILDENTPLFESIKEVIKSGVVFVLDKEKKIKGPITTADLNEEFTEQIEPYILLEQIENFLRLILDNKIIMNDIIKLLDMKDEKRELLSISDMTFGEYIRVIENPSIISLYTSSQADVR